MRHSLLLCRHSLILGTFLGASLLLAVLLTTATTAAAPTPGPTVWLQTPGQGPANNSEITVTVRISDAANLYGVQLTLDFDPAVLEVIDSNPAISDIQVQPGDCPQGDFPLANQADNVSGKVEYAVTQLFPTPPVSGHCSVAHIRFLTKAVTTTSLSFDEVILSDPDGQPITASISGVELTISGKQYIYLPLTVKN